MNAAEMNSCLGPHKQGMKIFMENRREAARITNDDFCPKHSFWFYLFHVLFENERTSFIVKTSTNELLFIL